MKKITKETKLQKKKSFSVTFFLLNNQKIKMSDIIQMV